MTVCIHFQKIIELSGSNRSWNATNAHILSTHRRLLRNRMPPADGDAIAYPGDDPRRASPDEFLRFVLARMTPPQSAAVADAHWRQQSQFCAICAADFAVYGRLEEVEEDAAFFLHESGLGRAGVNASLWMNKYEVITLLYLPHCDFLKGLAASTERSASSGPVSSPPL